jgi:hypothetical protein
MPTLNSDVTVKFVTIDCHTTSLIPSFSRNIFNYI